MPSGARWTGGARWIEVVQGEKCGAAWSDGWRSEVGRNEVERDKVERGEVVRAEVGDVGWSTVVQGGAM